MRVFMITALAVCLCGSLSEAGLAQGTGPSTATGNPRGAAVSSPVTQGPANSNGAMPESSPAPRRAPTSNQAQPGAANPSRGGPAPTDQR